MVGTVEGTADAVRATLTPPPETMDERVLAALRDERPGAFPRRRRRTPRIRRIALGLTALTAVVLVAVALRPPGPDHTAAAVTIRPLTDDCDHAGDGRLVVAGVWSGREAEMFAHVLDSFEERTGIEVAYEYDTRDIAAKLETRIERGCPPDVALLPQPGLIADLARDGHIHPIDARVRDLVRSKYSLTWRRLATVDGDLYGVWFKAADKSAVWYSKPALQRAGIDSLPATWADLVATAHSLRAAGINPFALAGGDGWTLTDWFENVYLRSAGPKRYDALARHESPWTDPSVVEALRTMASVLTDPALAGPPSQSLHTTFEQSVLAVFGPHPRSAMIFEGDFVRSFVPAGTRGAGFFPFPALAPGAQSSVVVGGDVAVLFSDDRPARRMMRFLASPEAARPWAEAGGFVSPNSAVPLSWYPDRLTRQAAQTLIDAQVVRFDLSDLQPPAFGATAGQGMWKIFRGLLVAPHDVDAAARQLESGARAAYDCERAVRGHC